MVIVNRAVTVRSLLTDTRETQLALTDWLKGSLTDRLRTLKNETLALT